MSDIRAQSRRDAEFDRFLAEAKDPEFEYDVDDMHRAYEMGKRHGREEGPRWHDAPTCPGWWMDDDGEAYHIAPNEMKKLGVMNGHRWEEAWASRWFGPLPADEVKP